MDTRTLTVTLALVTATLSLLMVLFAFYRWQRSLALYASGFVAGMAGFLLLLGQGSVSPWVSVLAANLLLTLCYACLPWGLRTAFRLPRPWARRYWVYLGLWCVAEVAATFVWDSYPARAAVSSLAFMLWAGEFLAAAWRAPGLSLPIKAASVTVAGAFVLAHLVRIVLLAGLSATDRLFQEDNGVTVYTLLMSVVFAMLWAGVILTIEVAGLLRRLEERNNALKALAHTDELTGLSNRHQLHQAMTIEKERCLRYRQPLSLVFFDLDHFKQINDTWGHPVGDSVLKQTAGVVRGLVRGPDSLFRWGGEEFMLLVPQTSLEGATLLAEKLRLALEGASFPVDHRVTASFGVAEWRPPETNESWIERVDLALYRAKNAGRNRVVAWQQGGSVPGARVHLEWRREWESGSRLVDDQHRQLLELANGLMDLSLANQPPPLVARQLDELVDHVARHFADEEGVLAEAAYPELPEHSSLHRGLLDEARLLRRHFDQGLADAASFFQFLVSQVVLGHILTADTRFFPYTRREAGL